MEVRKLIITAILIVLIISFTIVPINNTKEVIMHARSNDVAKEVDDLNAWKDWNPDLRNKNILINGTLQEDQSAIIHTNYSYVLHHINPMMVELRRNESGHVTSSVIEISALTDSTTQVEWSEKVSVFVMIKRNVTTHYSRQNNLTELKKLLGK